MQIDFSENYTITYQDEVQSAHWNAQQVSLYTAVVWAAKDTVSYTVVSNYMHHDKYAVACFNGLLTEDLKKRFPHLHTVDIFSDGAAQHFKQKYMLCFMTLSESECHVKINWHFFATSHGKGAVDGIGGHVKRAVWNAVKAGYPFPAVCSTTAVDVKHCNELMYGKLYLVDRLLVYVQYFSIRYLMCAVMTN